MIANTYGSTADYAGMPTVVNGLAPDDLEKLKELYKVWRDKLIRNDIKLKYYNGKNVLKDLGISIPPQLKNVNTTIGWAAKAVDKLAVRSQFDGFVSKDGNIEELEEILHENNFKELYRQLVTSELIHSCAFLTVSKGDIGEPDVLISGYGADNAAAVWNARHKRIDYGLTITATDKDSDDAIKSPIDMNLYTDTHVVRIYRVKNSWQAEYYPHGLGRPLIEPLVYSPSLNKPFGKSRISRAVMSITDSAVRTALRTEVSAEFFTTPQKYLLGADEEAFNDTSKWQAYIGTIFAVTKDEDGDIPQFGQLSQMSMQPHIDYMRSLAAQFAGETNIPISELGIIHDNPASADAIRAAKEALVMDAESLNANNGYHLATVGKMCLALSRGTSLDAIEERVTSNFRNPERLSTASTSDAILKQVQAFPWMADTRVALEELGYSEEKIIRLMSEKRRAEARMKLNNIFTKEIVNEENNTDKPTETV